MITLSPWSAEKYRTCPAIYWFDVVQRIESPWAWRPKMGTIAHRGFESVLRRQIMGRPFDGEARGKLAAELEEVTKEAIDHEIDWTLEREASRVKGRLLDYTLAIVDKFATKVAPALPVLDVERGFRIRIGDGVDVKGRIDQWLVAGVGDTKTTGRAPSRPDGSHRMQLALYGLVRAAFTPNPKGRLDYLVLGDTQSRGVEVKVQTNTIPAETLEADARTAIDGVRWVADRVQAGDFRRNLAACDDVYGRPCAHRDRCQPWRAGVAERKGQAPEASLPDPVTVGVELVGLDSPLLAASRVSLPIFGVAPQTDRDLERSRARKAKEQAAKEGGGSNG